MTQKAAGVGIKHVNHVVTLVKDLEKSLSFYRDFLGIRQIPKMVDSPDLVWLQLPSGVMLHLIKSDTPAPQRQHVAFEVEDIDAARRVAEEKGLSILSSGTRKDGQRFFFIPDPDGNRVELCTRSYF
jgi:catechol 2,3-dioxygenase-like lactoylglutathione lyase family enzyme